MSFQQAAPALVSAKKDSTSSALILENWWPTGTARPGRSLLSQPAHFQKEKWLLSFPRNDSTKGKVKRLFTSIFLGREDSEHCSVDSMQKAATQIHWATD